MAKKPYHRIQPGEKYGCLTVLEDSGLRSNGKRILRCQCECGNEVLANANSIRSGRTKGCGCLRYRTGPENPCWKTGRQKNAYGYIYIRDRNHPFANRAGQVAEHRLVIEKQIGRYLLPNETVHHKNGIRDDNRLENLELRAGNHGSGQSVDELVEHAKSILRQYAPEVLAETNLAISA